MLADASRGARLVPGDVIGSGTCGGILELALVRGGERYPWLKVGDDVEPSVEHLRRPHSLALSGPALVPQREGIE